MLEGQTAEAVLADKGYDTDGIVHYVKHCMKAVAVIPPKRNRIVQRQYDKDTYKMRNLIERAFNRFKHWRRIATRYDRCDSIFISSIALDANCALLFYAIHLQTNASLVPIAFLSK